MMTTANRRTLLWLTAVASVGLSLALAPSARGALVAHWDFEEGSGALTQDQVRSVNDSLDDENTGNSDGDTPPAWVTTGLASIPGSTTTAALDFDGVDDRLVADGGGGFTGVLGNTDRTTSAWIKTSTPDTDDVIMSWGRNATGEKWTWRLEDNGGVRSLRIEVSGGNYRGTTDVADGGWHHVAAIWSDNNVNDVIFMVDGKIEARRGKTDQAINTGATSHVNVRIADDFTNNRNFNGLIDDARIYDHALTPGEVVELYTGTKAARAVLSYDATADTNGDDAWQEQVKIRGAEFNLDMTGVTRNTGVSSHPGINAAYDVTGAAEINVGGVQGGFSRNLTAESVSFEIWFKPDDLSGQEVLFEAGGSTDGMSMLLDGDLLKFNAKDSGQEIGVSFDLDADDDGVDNTDFIQAVGVLDLDNDLIYLYVDGTLTNPGGSNPNTADLADWAGGDLKLGGADGTAGGHNGFYGALGSYGDFNGEIALFDVYNDVISTQDVTDLYNAVTVPEPATMAMIAAGGLVVLLRRRRKA